MSSLILESPFESRDPRRFWREDQGGRTFKKKGAVKETGYTVESNVPVWKRHQKGRKEAVFRKGRYAYGQRIPGAAFKGSVPESG